ncbi:LOW QUALITY PROTEIN: ciliogenesis and planar polarity effector 1 [Tachyglossus aculeatus]|uniref:LOW QUALITY PROTEIN: ciliogenesis and planar polarity effector 1 n=1 Tax=Tachyglossus aculeatus TaxID=9261 RepID=UPI0018F6415B|nr:LOW QUALITY PROTEIN: ciliogenesis and planar polarity effector 1 [Tachyglossus aculeatus]
MEIKLEVIISTSIKQRKPWPKISWLGQENEATFLLDGKDINEIDLLSGRTKKKIPRLQSLLKNVVVLATSRSGAWLAGLLSSGDLFLWNKDQDCLKTISASEESTKMTSAAQECFIKLHLYVSGDGKRVLLTTSSGFILLWECLGTRNDLDSKNPSLIGQWSQIKPEESVRFPSTEDKEAAVNAIFVNNETLGDCCLCSFIFYSRECLTLTFLAVRWLANGYRSFSSLPYQVFWAQQKCVLSSLVPKCESVKSRGALISAFAGDGLLLAITINQRDPKATQVLFINTLNFVTTHSDLKGCSNKNPVVPSRLIRSYWVGDISWTHDNLFLACMLKRGSLVLLTYLGEMLTLVTSGCCVEFGPAEFIPLHPLITYRPQPCQLQDSDHNLNSSASDNDPMRQRFSVTAHSRLPYLIVSDGYMVTVLKFLENLSPTVLMKSLLLDSTQRLEKMHQGLMISKTRGKSLRLQTLASLKSSLLMHQENNTATFLTIPKFLQKEEETGKFTEKTADFQDYEEEESDKRFSKSLSFGRLKLNSSFSTVEEGRLEFASMFDTLHAVDNTRPKGCTVSELNSIQKNLLAAWSLGISKNIEEKSKMLNYTVVCIAHFLYILQFTKCPSPKPAFFLNQATRHNAWLQCVFHLFHQCLSIQFWDMRCQQDMGHLVRLTSQTLQLMFIQQKQDRLFSETLLGGFHLLKMVSESLNVTYCLQNEVISSSADVNRTVNFDSLVVPVFQEFHGNHSQKMRSWDSLFCMPPQAVNLGHKPGNRLAFLWRLLYKQALWYQTQISRKISKSDVQLTEKITFEESIVKSLLGHIQAALQATGDSLDHTLKLKSVSGEEHFLLGAYEVSVQLWKKALQEAKGIGRRTCYLQTRYLLAILYCHLYHYNLNDAQGLCDQLVRAILRRSHLIIKEEEDSFVPENLHCAFGMIEDVHPEAAVVVIQSVARFMTAYFTNHPLYVLPPHNVNILPPLHINSGQSPRVVPLQHAKVSSVVRDQNLSEVWTVEYALELLLIGGLLPEAVWLVHTLGDWKMSVSIGLAINLFCKNNSSLSKSKKKNLNLPLNLTPEQTFQEKLQSFLGQPDFSEALNEVGPKYKQFTDPIEEEDANVLFGSVQEILKAAVMADADILSETFQLLMDSAKDLSKRLWGLVPVGLYLPAPPLYCPQPAFLSEEEDNDPPLKIERDYRRKVSGLLQRILLLFRAARCSFPAAQWYIVKLKWARKVMQKIRLKASLPLLNPLPQSLLNYSKVRLAFFKPGAAGDHACDEVSSKTIGCFRELCALCWMLHVRDKLSYSCRQYQAARENVEKKKDCEMDFDACVIEHSLSAVEWACRLLPFSRFMNIEELVQDIILSLVAELPPIRKVAEILVKAFPNPEDIRVPLRDKYHSLQQRLRHCTVKGPQTEEMMSVVLRNIQKVRSKALRRVRRNIGPFEMNIWEPDEDEHPNDETQGWDRYSLEASWSRSTLTELGSTVTQSDADLAETLSEVLTTERPRQQLHSDQRNNRRFPELTSLNKDNSKKKKYCELEEKPKIKDHENLLGQNRVPLVGAWEFERDDEEYVKFLDLFLSYMLERDLVGSSDPGIPFLTSFSTHLKEHELNSLLFDVHTTLKRRQGKTKSQNVFRAGCCYTVVPASCGSEKSTLDNEKQNGLENQVPTLSELVLQGNGSSKQNLLDEVSRNKGKQGLFGLTQKSIYRMQDDNREIPLTSLTHNLSDHAFPAPQSFKPGRCTYKAISWNDISPREELPLELNNKFGSIARLLEWMIRWSDRRLLCDSSKTESFPIYSPVIRVRTSAAAILTSLWLLETPRLDECKAKNVVFKVPEHQYTVAPVFLPASIPRVETESGADTGCPAATANPKGIQEGNDCEEGCNGALELPVAAKDPEVEENSIENFSLKRIAEKGATDIYEDLLEVETFTQDEVESYSSYDEENFEGTAGSVGNSISITIKPVQQPSERQSSVAEVRCPDEEPVEEMVMKMAIEQDSLTEAVVNTKLIPHTLDENTALSSERMSEYKEHSSTQPSLVRGESASSGAPACSKHQNTQENEPSVQPPNASDPVRQMLQDEMFRLLQLQQINFMSLMQVVGSSFANLPMVQQLLQQPQASGLTGPVTCTGNDLQADTPVRQEAMGDHAKQADRKSSLHCQEEIPPKDQNHTGNIQSHSNSRGQIPSPETLLSPAPPGQTASNHLQLLSPSPGTQKIPPLIPVAKSLNPVNGFPLLKLETELKLYLPPVREAQASLRPPLQPRKAWGPANSVKETLPTPFRAHNPLSTAHLNLNQYDADAVQKALEQKRWAETVNQAPPKHLNLDQYVTQENSLPQQDPSREISGEETFNGTPAPLGASCQNFSGIPLLHLQRRDFTPLLLSTGTAPVSVPSLLTGPLAKEQDSRRILHQWKGTALLHSRLARESKYRQPKLIPLENLMAFEQSLFEQGQPRKIQLLKTEIQPPEARQEVDNKKRQRRRAKKNLQEKNDKEQERKPSVTFRPDESIISTVDEEVLLMTKEKQDEPKSQDKDGFAIPFESLGEDISTSAGLHYMASIRKKAVEIQDASTNTEPVLKSLQTKEATLQEVVSEPGPTQPVISPEPAPETLSVPQVVPPDVFLNLRFPDEIAEKPSSTSTSAAAPNLGGHQYINVIDIEASDILKGLPVIDELKDDAVVQQKSEKPEVPSSAKLHFMAASVTNVHHPDLKSDGEAKSLLQVEAQNLKSDHVEDRLTWNRLCECVPADPPMVSSSGTLHKEHLVTEFQKMDEKLLALQNMAENIEKDFSNTKLLVKTIENWEETVAPNVDKGRCSSRAFRESDQGHSLIPLDFEDPTDEKEEILELEFVDNQIGHLKAHSLSSITSSSHSTVKSGFEGITYSEELVHSFSADPLQITGLTDVADIIHDLVKDGGISAHDLGLTENQARKITSTRITRQPPRTEKEKKEIRAWMKRKQKERMAEYLGKLAEQRAQEHDPFHSRRNANAMTSREIRLSQKLKVEKDKMLQSKYRSHRVLEAVTLMNELLSETVQLPTDESRPLSGAPGLARGLRRQLLPPQRGDTPHGCTSLTSQAEKIKFASRPVYAQKRSSLSRGPQNSVWSKGAAKFAVQKQTRDAKVTLRNAPRSPVTSRQTQTSKAASRGASPDLNKEPPHLQRPSQQKWKLQGRRPVAAIPASSYPTPNGRYLSSPAGSQSEADGAYEREQDVVSPWTVPPEIHRILHDNHDPLFEGSLIPEDNGSRLSANGLDTISESTESILSKLDWNAVDAMVASVEDK